MSEYRDAFEGITFPPVPVAQQQQPRPHRYGERYTPAMGDAPEQALEAAASFSFAGDASEYEKERLERQTRNHKTRADFFQTQLLLSRLPRLAETLRHLDQDVMPELFRHQRLERMSTKELEMLAALLLKRQDLDQRFILEMMRHGPKDLPSLVERVESPIPANASRAAAMLGGLRPAERQRMSVVASSLLRLLSKGTAGGPEPGPDET